MSPEEVARKAEQLDLELRMLKDDNFRLREEQLILQRDLKDASSIRSGKPGSQPQRQPNVPISPSSRMDLEQQLTYMRELVRNYQSENARLTSRKGGSGVSEAQYRQLHQKAAQLQQAHLRQVQEARQLQVNLERKMSSSGAATPRNIAMQVSSRGSFGSIVPGSGGITDGDAAGGSQGLRELQAQLAALTQENESLRGKVRKLAHNQ